MSIVDLRDLPDGSQLEADVCVVGSGPAGLTLALQFIGTATQVCVLESGGFVREAETEALGGFENVGLRRAPHDVVRCRGLGGTSALWTGRCGVMDDIDFVERPWVPHSGWPIRSADLEPHFEHAGALLGLGPALYSDRVWQLLGGPDRRPRWDARRLLPVVWQYSRGSQVLEQDVRSSSSDGAAGGVLQHAGAPAALRFGDAYRKALAAAQNVRVLLHANATNLKTDETGARIRSVDVRSLEGKQARVEARIVVLCCGGIDNARILLASNTVDPRGVGNARDVVGRYLMDHPYVPIATYEGAGSKPLRRRLGYRWVDRRGTRRVYQLGLRLSPAEQRKRGLLNSAIHLLEFSSSISAVGAAGRVVRAFKNGGWSHVDPAHLRQALFNPAALVAGVGARYLLRRPSLVPVNRVEIACISEQAPNPESRVTLSATRDALGMNEARIDWRASDLELDTVRAMASIVTNEIARLGYEPPIVTPWFNEEGAAATFRATIRDFSHPMGTTRMSADPKQGVVDANCRVHGVEGLYVAGSSVFSTSGYMNPTLMIVALSLRLAQHLKAQLAAGESSPAGAGPAASALSPALPAPRRARVALVGAGDRIRTIYRPVLAALQDGFEAVGVTARTQQSADAFSRATAIPSFSDVGSMITTTKPDFVIVAVPVPSIAEVMERLVGLGVPALLETPVAANVRRGRAFLNRIARAQLTVGVAEQTPFLPVEQLRRRLINLGLIGQVVSTHNDFLSYDYHGIARLRAYLGHGRAPVMVSAVESRPPSLETGAAGEAAAARPSQAAMLATVLFDDGASLVHHYGPAYCDAHLRSVRSVRVYGTAGSLVGDELTCRRGGGEPDRVAIERVKADDGGLAALTARTPLGEVRWDNPYAAHPLNDEQIAVAVLLERMKDAVLFGGLPAYTASEALEDIELLAAMRYSARRDGSPVRLPLKPAFEKARVAAHLRLVRKRSD